MTTTETLTDIIRGFAKGASFDLGTDLFNAGVLDSFGVISLLAAIEDSFGVRFDESDLTTDNFRSIAQIAGMVERYRSAAKA